MRCLAGLTSIRACLQNPGVMLLWGALITGIILLAMLPVFLGLFIAGPVIGHATWHAYRHIVPRPTPAPEAMQDPGPTPPQGPVSIHSRRSSHQPSKVSLKASTR